MKSGLLFALLLSIIACSLLPAQKVLNTNSWSVSLNKELLLTSEKNKPGEIMSFSRKQLHPSDTLFVTRYLCSFSAENRESVLLVKYEEKEILRFGNKNKGVVFLNTVPVYKIMNSMNANKERIFDLYSYTLLENGKLDNGMLVGRLQLH